MNDVSRIDDLEFSHEGGATEASIVELVSGIVHDAETLFQQQLALFRNEVKDDIRKAKEAFLFLGLGAGISVIGGWLLLLMLVYLLAWASSWPLWCCYGLVGGGLSLIGGAVLWRAKAKLRAVHPLPEQSLHALEENIQCLTKTK